MPKRIGQTNGYPTTDIEEPARPFHLWDAKEHESVRYRYYSDARRAHMAALIQARWAKVGTTIEVFDVRTARMLGQYTRRIETVHFLGK